MNIIADENIAIQVVERLQKEGHNVKYTLQGQRITDDVVLNMAHQQKALLITDDKDFGELLILRQQPSSGVLLVRLAGFSPQEKAEVVAQVIHEHGDQLMNTLTVITPRGIRRRQLNTFAEEGNSLDS